jgi:hypothetical protein
MKILLIEPLQHPKVLETSGTLSAMQTLVGGTIQALYPFNAPVALICHDEGKLLNLPPNRALYHPETNECYDIVVGTFFLCGAPPDGDSFTSLTQEQIETYTARFRNPEFAPHSKGGDL